MKALALPFLCMIGVLLCATSHVASKEFASAQDATTIYFILVTIIYLLLSLIYFTFFHYSRPSSTASSFSIFLIFLNLGVRLTLLEMVSTILISFIVTFLVGWLYYRFFRSPNEAPPDF